MQISVFGGSSVDPTHEEYLQALELGGLLAAELFTVLNGGYMGTMEAVSRGAAESGGHVIGVTSDEIESWRPSPPNTWLTEEKRFNTARERLFYLIDQCDAAIALPGGVGTLAEIAVMWKAMIISTPKPLILLGDDWKHILENIYDRLYEHFPNEHKKLVSFAENNEICIQLLRDKIGET